MKIREAQIEDFGELRAFYVRLNEVINIRNNNLNPDNPAYPSDELIRNAISKGEQLVGMEDGRIVAACIVNNECQKAYLGAKWKVSAGEDEFWVLHALRIAPEYEGRGFAKQMLSFIIDRAKERGIKAIRLDILEDYPVQRLYYQFGFEYVETVELLYEDIGYPKRFKLLEKEI